MSKENDNNNNDNNDKIMDIFYEVIFHYHDANMTHCSLSVWLFSSVHVKTALFTCIYKTIIISMGGCKKTKKT